MPKRIPRNLLILALATLFGLGAAWLAWMGACSRVLLQVHYASDVLAGLASGSVWLGLCIVGLRYAHAPQALPVRA